MTSADLKWQGTKGRFEAKQAALFAKIPTSGPVDSRQLATANGRKIAAVNPSNRVEWTDADHAKLRADPKIAEIMTVLLKPKALYCPGTCETEPWQATDPAEVGVLVRVDSVTSPHGDYVREEQRVGTAYATTYTFRALLVPEDVVVAEWQRRAFPPVQSQVGFEMGRLGMDVFRTDMAALAAGHSPASP